VSNLRSRKRRELNDDKGFWPTEEFHQGRHKGVINLMGRKNRSFQMPIIGRVRLTVTSSMMRYIERCQTRNTQLKYSKGNKRNKALWYKGNSHGAKNFMNDRGPH